MMSPLEKMFDQPGPKGLRLARIYSVMALVALLALLWFVLHAFYESGGMDKEKWEIFTSPSVLKLLGVGLYETLKAAASAGVLALALGTVLALLRLSQHRWVRVTVGAYVEATRSLPTLLVLYFTILILPYYGVRLPIYWQLVMALVITNAAMITEILRASLLSVPKGQTEAALSVGLTRPRAFALIVLPQGFRAALPALIAQVIYLLKGTVLGYVISYQELLFSARIIGEYTEFLLQSYIVAALIYLVLNIILSRVALWLERRVTTQMGAEAAPLPEAQ